MNAETDNPHELTRVSCLPSKRLLVLLAIGIVPLLFVPFLFEVLWVVVGYDLVLLAGMTVDFATLRRGARIRVIRAREAQLSVGADNPIGLHIENRGSEWVRVWIRDGYPAEFEAAGDDIGTNDEVTLGKHQVPGIGTLGRPETPEQDVDVDVLAEGVGAQGKRGFRRLLSRELNPGGTTGPGLAVPGGTAVDVDYRLTPMRRGNYRFGDIHLRAETRLGLATLAGVQAAADDVRVFPNIRNVRNLELATRFRDLRHLGLKRVRSEGDGSEFANLRDYVEGDSYRDINWKATARRRKPVTQVYEAERSQDLVICIDAGRLMASRTDQLAKIDHAINATLLLTHSAIRNGDRVGLIVFDDEIRTFVPPAKGQRQYRTILGRLYNVEPKLCQVDYRQLVMFLLARVKRRALVVMFTDLADERTAQALVDYGHHLMPRHLPLCVAISDPGLTDVRNRRCADEKGVFDRAVATEMLRGRELLKTELVRRGAHVIDRPGDKIAVETINRYVELKQRRAL